ncbi:hypothetical protein ACFPM0_04040 [Pseudonocardia sulfidoxydans]|uniref:hypothetical protein n=1 Tax=Pseudonocardia sulfidoxydans TaxID=54011 RepID=UPI00360D3798
MSGNSRYSDYCRSQLLTSRNLVAANDSGAIGHLVPAHADTPVTDGCDHAGFRDDQ